MNGEHVSHKKKKKKKKGWKIKLRKPPRKQNTKRLKKNVFNVKIRGTAPKVYLSNTVIGIPLQENNSGGNYEEIIQEDFSELRQVFLVCERIHQVPKLMD